MKYQKIADRFFAVENEQRYYLVYTYPMQVFELEADSLSETAETGKELLEENEIVINSRKEDFHNFFSLDWLITADCNLNCAHCFAKKSGENYRYGLSEPTLSFSHLKKSVHLALDILAEHLDPQDLGVRFELFIIGGEPLLEKKLIYRGIDFLDKKLEQFRLEHGLEKIDREVMIVSNGIEIDNDFADFCLNHNIGITVSVDAPGYMQKIDANGLNHTPKVIKNIKLLLDKGLKNVAVNFVIPPDKLKETDKVFSYLENEGILHKLKTVQMSPQIPPHRQTKYCGCNSSEIMISDFGEDFEACELFAEKMLGYERKYHMDIKEYNQKMHSLIEIGGMAYRCPVAQNKFCIVPGGDIYPCHQLIQISGFLFGNIDSMDLAHFKSSPVCEKFCKRRVFDVKPCDSCLLQSVCITFVDCPARCFLESGDMFQVPIHYCKIAKKYLEDIFQRFLTSLSE